MISRREALTRIGTAAGVAAFAPRVANAQATQKPVAQKVDPPSVISNPPRDFSQPVSYPDPDIIALDKRFKYKLGNTPILRLYTGTLWAEGCAWNGASRYLVWSDIPRNENLRYLEEDDHISRMFRSPSMYSNGNTFD